MADPPLLAVRGQVVLELEPEIARVSVTVTAKDADRAKALRLLDQRGVAIDDVLRSFGTAVERVETGAVRVNPWFKDTRPRERVAGYAAVVARTVTVVDFARLGELIAQLASQDLTDVAGPWWALRPASPAYRRARVEAVRDAVERARDYAGALGSDVVELVELADTGLLSDEGPPPVRMAAPAAAPQAFAARGAPAPAEFTFDITPATQVVRASVEARFRMSPPDLSWPAQS